MIKVYTSRLVLSLLVVISLISTSTFAMRHKDYSNNFTASNQSVEGRKVFVFDPRALTWKIYSNGRLIRSGHAVGGKSYCPDIHRGCRTPVGTFHIYSKAGPNFISSKFPPPHGGAHMPWAMFFHGGYAIHGSNEVPNHNASHGCIRVYPSDAKWMNTHFLPMGTTVIVRPY